MENKYYTPQIEDLRIGYICDHTTMSSTFDENDINIVRNDDDLSIDDPLYGSDIERYSTWCNDDDSLRNYVRTKYLDKEDIESLGFQYIAEERLESKGDFVRFSKDWSDCPPDSTCFDHFYGKYWLCLQSYSQWDFRVSKILLYKEEQGGFIGKPPEDFILFAGDCPSINELKFLMKLLNIK